LTPYDIAILDFRDKFFFEGQYWILNRIFDYNPIENKTTKCEFILLKAGVPFSSETKSLNGGLVAGGFAAGESIPVYNSNITTNDNFYSPSLNEASGRGNIIDNSASAVSVNGYDNSVGRMASNITLTNSSGCTVLANVTGVTLINCSGLTVDSRYNGLTVINNTIQGFKKILRKTASYKSVSADVGSYVLFEPSSNVTIDLPEAVNIANGWSIEIKNANQTVFTVTANIVDSSLFEDGVSITDVILSTESFVYTYRNGKWYIT
jgi:hypothetical protein